MGDLASKLAALESAAKALGSGGVLGVKSTSSSSSFSVAPGAGAAAGSYRVHVDALASPAKSRSAGFGSDDVVLAGSLDISVDGVVYSTGQWQDGASLADVADAIRASGAPVSAAVLNNGTNSFLSITKRDSGFTSDTADQSLVVTENTSPDAVTGRTLDIASIQTPTNASFTVDDLSFTRTSNVVTDAIPGTTLTLQQPMGKGAYDDVTLENDVAGTKAKLQTYVDAYNAVMSAVQTQLSPAQGTDRSSTLTGDSSVRMLQQQLQSLGIAQVPGLGSVRTLADLGVKTQKDGTLTIDDATLGAAITRDPGAVDALFSTASTGLAAVVTNAVESYVDPTNGLLTLAQAGLNDSVKRMDDEIANMQARADQYRASLVAQFAAMEQVVSQYKNIGTFLQNESQQQNKS
jgi:flagellar hook-associated protein 2